MTQKGYQFINEKRKRTKKSKEAEEGARGKGTEKDALDDKFDAEELKFLGQTRK